VISIHGSNLRAVIGRKLYANRVLVNEVRKYKYLRIRLGLRNEPVVEN
jgi:hypothetical protein